MDGLKAKSWEELVTELSLLLKKWGDSTGAHSEATSEAVGGRTGADPWGGGGGKRLALVSFPHTATKTSQPGSPSSLPQLPGQGPSVSFFFLRLHLIT